jgi:hypothetical protein
MSAFAVVTVASRGLPVVDVTATRPALGRPVTEATNGRGIAVTKVTALGLAVTFVPLPGGGGGAAPVNTMPGAQTTAENTAKPITGVSVNDPDTATLTTTLSVLHGTLAVAAGGTIGGNNTASVTVSGTIANINTSLAGLIYTPAADYDGPDTLTVLTSDGTLTDSDTVAITVTAAAAEDSLLLSDGSGPLLLTSGTSDELLLTTDV